MLLLAIVFLTVELLPGDAASSTVDRGADADAVAVRRAELGLDRPLLERFADWLTALPTGDLGISAHGQPVSTLLAQQAPNTILLGVLAFVVTMTAAVTLGGHATLHAGRRADRVISFSAGVVLTLPEFVVASLLVLVLALWSGLLPAVTVTTIDGWPAEPSMLVLPVLALAIPQIGWNTQVVRAALADQYAAPHVDAAQLDGLSPRQVLLRHVLPGALPTIAAGAATSVGMVLGGAVVVETIFGYPGVGTVVAGAIRDRDTPVIAGATAVTGLTISGVLLAADLIREWATGRRM
ncbi:ABC transporter permease [Micromonospora purpureochromogenes]|uniref:ABC transporter permease n=1 Tax=Micromonospora purpureochromogenes TaxID=47872 RepID=UPI0033CCA7D8